MQADGREVDEPLNSRCWQIWVLARELPAPARPARVHLDLISCGGEQARERVQLILAFSRRQPH